MAVSTEISQIVYLGNGSTTTAYSIPFPFLDVTHIDVEISSDGVAPPAPPGLDTFTVTRASDGQGGSVVTDPAVPATSTITITRITPLTQPAVFQAHGPLPAKTIETSLDREEMQIQELDRRLSAAEAILATLGEVVAGVPDAPTIGTATATGATTATVAFTAPSSDGGAAIVGYSVVPYIAAIAQTALTIPSTVTAGQSGTLTVAGLTASTAYTFTVAAINSAGTGAASGQSNSITTQAAPVGQARYLGASVNTSLSNAQVLALSVDSAADRAKTGSVITTDGQYVYYVYPASFGQLTAVYLNGDTTFNNLDGFQLTTQSVTPSGGVATGYNVYRSVFQYIAATTSHQFI